MRIVIDLQGAQTESRFRGIGRYTLSLAKAIVRNRGDHEIIIALSGLFPDSIGPIRAAFDELLPQENIRVWLTPAPVRECELGNTYRREAAELIREAFLSSLQPDIIFLMSLFEGYVDDAVTSIGLFDKTITTAVILYDLIPYIKPEVYLHTDSQRDYYYRKINSLKQADLLLAISECSKQESVDALGLPEKNITTILSAVDERFSPAELSADEIKSLKQRYTIERKMVMYAPGGFDVRKNFDGLIKAYALLPKTLRMEHQLVIVSQIQEGNRISLMDLAKQAGLDKDELVLTGYVPDEDLVALYSSATLFVFPSKHEGFGLPVLEAMKCGAPVIGSNTTSIPEVIGNNEALFDPDSVDSIAAKIQQALQNESFRKELIEKSAVQVRHFSWDKSAKGAIATFEKSLTQKISTQVTEIPQQRPKLAFVSPLPPERTGIADYSAELLPALSCYYEIDVIVAQDKVTDHWVNKNCQINSAEWFLKNASQYDRVLYHFGNSPFHQHMYSLLAEIPGAVCLHDFYMSNYSRYMELTGQESYHWVKDLYYAHGYHAVRDRYYCSDEEAVMYQYPCNFKILKSANGIIVHSNYSKQLADEWYGESQSKNWSVIPLLRQPSDFQKIIKPREKCNIPEKAFVVCAFGLLDSSKLNHRLLNAWLASDLSKDPNSYLIFVGENHGGEYGSELLKTIKESGVHERIRITGWISHEVFQAHLAAADMAVQLRASSRGETSAAILDCMNYGLPTIVNANGAMAELPIDAVCLLEDEFEDCDLIETLETLWQDPNKRQTLSSKAKHVIETLHSPKSCAKQYAEAIESFHRVAQTDSQHLITALSENNLLMENEDYLKGMASCIAQNQPDQRPARTFFIDITATSRNDLKTGIERVARALLLQFINKPPKGFRVEPVYLINQGGIWHYRYARSYTLGLLECPDEWLSDDLIEAQPGDILFVADLAGDMVVEAEKAGVYERLKNIGVSINFTVFDLLPQKHSVMFPPGASEAYESWLSTVCRITDRVVCISKTVADELSEWHGNTLPARPRPLKIDWFHLGSDVMASVPSRGIPDEAEKLLVMLTAKSTFLMVGTIEPRKGHIQTIEAFEQLWQQGVDVNLAIVGKEGWQGLPDNQRRTIPQIVEKLRQHPELGKRLFWLEGISDEYLEKVYAASTCLIASSEDEGFGLPLIEAAQHKLPIIARDIPVFREVAGGHAFYFSGIQPDTLSNIIKEWLELYKVAKATQSVDLPWLTWEQSTKQLLRNIINGEREVRVKE